MDATQEADGHRAARKCSHRRDPATRCRCRRQGRVGDTAGLLAVVEGGWPPGKPGRPCTCTRSEDEALYVVEGTLLVQIGEEPATS